MVKFKSSWRNYFKGEIAGFSEEMEAWLVKMDLGTQISPALKPSPRKKMNAAKKEEQSGQGNQQGQQRQGGRS